ncbi:DNA-binding protein SMUBP-2 [Lophium mytilinum]|uniref:DNA-binding protein SMUBP-2 n=1 Tax=Lophium mytilinum TaxID=390894 RepID=A0A6A6R441_9PEZI|nr:DNA-binding protein SMUBP-2 [Lophium mytilinum]
MAEIIQKIEQIKRFPADLHLFCPRTARDEAGVYYEEDIIGSKQKVDEAEKARRIAKIKKAEERKWLVLDALQILAFNGPDAEPYHEEIKKRLSNQLTNCDVCVRVFHKSRGELKFRLAERFEDDDVETFLEKLDEISIRRIVQGLEAAKSSLLHVEPDKRGIDVLTNKGIYAFFETLSCAAMLENDGLLKRHFDEPFELVQMKRRVRLNTYVPAMTKFLFTSNTVRQDWALFSWTKLKRVLTRTEFDWAVSRYLQDAMGRVQMTALEMDLVPAFWTGARFIIARLDKDLITHGLRALEYKFYTLCLDHLSLDSSHFNDLQHTIELLLQKSPADFWDAMGAISEVVVVEQIFGSPSLRRILMGFTGDDMSGLEELEESFSWVMPLLDSIKPSNIAPVCRALAHQFFGRLQGDKFSWACRASCFKLGLEVLDYTLRKLCNPNVPFVGQATVADIFEMLATHIDKIVLGIKQVDGIKAPLSEVNLGLSVIQHAFNLECISLENEREAIINKQPAPTGPSKATPIWKSIIKAIDVENMDLAVRLLIGGKSLVGLEKFFRRQKEGGAQMLPSPLRHFNNRFDDASETITAAVERLSEFDPEKLDGLFENPVSASAVIPTIFSSQPDTREATLELLKIVSSMDERRDAIKHLLLAFYTNSITTFATSLRRIFRKRVFAPASSMLKACRDIIEVLCNDQDGILRSRRLSEPEARITTTLWENMWSAVAIIFRTTEDWSNMGYNKEEMKEFCRDTMQFADQLFGQCSIFASALRSAKSSSKDDTDRFNPEKELLEHPAKSVKSIAKWLRLRDDWLSTISVSLISKLLTRLKKVSIEVDDPAVLYVESVLDGSTRAKLSDISKAELEQAFETYTGRSTKKIEETIAVQKQAQLSSWLTTGLTKPESRPRSITEEHDRLIANSTRGAEAFKARQASKTAATLKAAEKKAADKAAEQSEFKRKREAEKEAKKKRDALAVAQAKKNIRGFSDHTAEAGSGLDGIGVLGKDHAAKGEGMMVSSDESDSDDSLDAELFGLADKKKKASGTVTKTNITTAPMPQGPVKKRRVVRSIKDMRARLAPDLSPLHKVILAWDYYHEGHYPPKSRPDMYSEVPNSFRTPVDYQRTFEPLLTLEAWQGFVKTREENNIKMYEIKVVARSSVDMFQEVSSTMTHMDNKDLNLGEGDIVLLHRSRVSTGSQDMAESAKDPHCLARVFRITRKKDHLEVMYRVMPGNSLQNALVPKGTVFGAKLQSITPLEREYGALLGLEYYDLCDEIIKAKPSPLLKYSDKTLEPLITNYNVNKAQAKAIKSAIDNDAFTLIQGPPGSGKTKTIVAIVGAILTESLRQQGTTIPLPKVSGAYGQRAPETTSKKLMVCAPSNAAVDELVMRFKDGIKTLGGQTRKVNIVRLGRSDAINTNVVDVTLEALVNKKLNLNSSNGTNDREKTQKLFQEHQAISEQLRQVREQLDAGLAKGDDAVKLKDDFNALRRRKTQLGTQIDNTKDKEKLESREKELNRRRAQQQILDDAHIICATLSGSGHDMFQNLNIEFETVVVDEAAQCVEMSALIPLKYGCAKCILVGDPKQLPPTVFSAEAKRYQYEQSLFVRMQGNHQDDVHLLDTQYRMHPEISLFPSQTFYDGRLLDGDDMAGLRQRPWHSSSLLAPYRFFDVQGQHQSASSGHSIFNIAEIEVAMQLFDRLTKDFKDYDFAGKIGIITPYKSQLRELKNRFGRKYGEGIFDTIEFNTTDAYQGRESEIIIFSCVRASPKGSVGFLQDIRRMNVGLTRAKSSLWVLGNAQNLSRGEFWNKLLNDARARDRYTQGNLTAMLQKPSSSFPAKNSGTNAGAYGQPSAPLNAPTGPSRNASYAGQVKQETRAAGYPSYGQEHSVSRRPSSDTGLGLKASAVKKDVAMKLDFSDDEDVYMKDISSADGNASSKGSRRSTPAPHPGGARNGPKKEAGPAVPAPRSALTKAGDDSGRQQATGGQPNPAPPPRQRLIPPKRKREVDPFIKIDRTKKPKPG